MATSPPSKLHRRIRNSCLRCQHRKIRCTRERPQCHNCLRLSQVCQYETPRLAHSASASQPPTGEHSSAGSERQSSVTRTTDMAGAKSDPKFESVLERLGKLEQALAQLVTVPPSCQPNTAAFVSARDGTTDCAATGEEPHYRSTWHWSQIMDEIFDRPSIASVSALFLLLFMAYHEAGTPSLYALVGLLIRTSRSIGLHIDPEPLGTPTRQGMPRGEEYQGAMRSTLAETRRRLWHQVLHLDLMACDARGVDPDPGGFVNMWPNGPRTSLPANLDDDEIALDSDISPLLAFANDRGRHTEMSMQLARLNASKCFRKLASLNSLDISTGEHNMIQEIEGAIQGMIDENQRLYLQYYALELFSYLCHSDDGSSSTPGFMAFDAHVGDTCCHVRAVMFWRLRSFITNQDNESSAAMWHGIDLAIIKLSVLVKRAKQLCHDLTVKRRSFAAVGLSPADQSRKDMLEKLGWYDSTWDIPALPGRGPFDKDKVSLAMDDLISPHKSEAVATWDPSNIGTVIRLIVYSYRLSKYKVFCHLDNSVGARLDPSASLDATNQLMDGFWNRSCPNFSSWKSTKRATHDFNAMQNWLAELSCSWMIEMGKKDHVFGPDLIRLPKQLLQVSSTGLSALPSYLGWLVIRSVLAEDSTPMLIIDKHFCSHGLHFNYFSVKLGHLPPGSKFAGADLALTWSLTQVYAQDLLASKDTTPRYIISGNSLDGHFPDFIQRISNPVSRHQDADCVENVQHCKDILATDQDALALASLADHRHYPFLLAAGCDEIAVVAEAMDDVMPGLSQIWKRQKDGADALGTSTSMKVFNWQHIVLETVARVAARYEASDGLSPVGAPTK
ncbi:hypothetical protein DV735_g2017, partial [Chaetothyriales sp. CBS 134920]